jgi:hypothetical protein
MLGSIAEVYYRDNIVTLDFVDKSGNKYSVSVIKQEEKNDGN